MCITSAVIDYGRRQWPIDMPMVPNYTLPQSPWTSMNVPTRDELDAFRKLLEQAKEFDRIAKQPKCEDPLKVEWLERLVSVMERLEKKLEA